MFRALAKDPADRFSSVSTFAEALEEAFFGTTNNAFVDKGEEELHVSRASSPAPGGRPCNLWQEICKVFAFDLLAGTLFGSVSTILGVQLQSIWFFLSLLAVLGPLGAAFARKSHHVFLLTCALAILALLPGVLFHSLVLFAIIYLVLVLLILL